MVTKRIIVSMATIPSRKERLLENLPAILNQSYYFDKLIINITDNLSDDDYEFYDSLTKKDDRISINRAEAKWRSCNKLLPTIKSHPEDVIITIDDDIYYPKHCFKYLVEQYEKTPNCVIAHEINPLLLDEGTGYISFYNGRDIKLMQKEWGKYLSGCALFPPHIFDGTDLFDYDKMMKCTNAVNDELWFWINSTLNGIMVVGLNYVSSFALDVITPWEKEEFRLANFNNSNEKLNSYMKVINEMYGERLLKQINNRPAIFTLDKDNVYSFMLIFKLVKKYYGNHWQIVTKDLTKGWLVELKERIKE